MTRTRLCTAGIVFAALLASPGSASAGIIDFIWEMSGPQMAGVPITCDIDVRTGEYQCRALELHIKGDRNFRRGMGRLWIAAGGGVYISTGKNTTMREFGFGSVQLVAVEPTLHLRSYESAGRAVAVEHGLAGLSYFVLHGDGFETFDKLGVKTIPIEVRIKRFTAAYTFRLFPEGFTSAEFGVPAGSPNTHTGREIVHGFILGWRWGAY